jgi:hypothetical protein
MKSKRKRKYLFTASDRFDEQPDRIRAVKNKRYKYIRNYNLNNSHALPVSYRTQMHLMRHLNKLNDLNALSPKQKLWYKFPKSREEFYDLENDPFELNNLIGDENYSKILNNLRNQLNMWMEEVNDLGHISEKELSKFLTH